MDNQNEDFNIALIPIFEKVLTSDVLSDRVRELQMSALKRLHSRLLDYEKRGYMKRLLYRIAAKKGEMILEIKTKTEMEKLFDLHPPHYDGAKFTPHPYSIPEEELICWSETSLKAPLNEAGFQRYMELFQSILPEESNKIFQNRKEQCT